MNIAVHCLDSAANLALSMTTPPDNVDLCRGAGCLTKSLRNHIHRDESDVRAQEVFSYLAWSLELEYETSSFERCIAMVLFRGHPTPVKLENK